jgi:hypothetical protein
LPAGLLAPELPPVNAEIIGEHVLEATSERLRASLAHRDELWDPHPHRVIPPVAGGILRSTIASDGRTCANPVATDQYRLSPDSCSG